MSSYSVLQRFNFFSDVRPAIQNCFTEMDAFLGATPDSFRSSAEETSQGCSLVTRARRLVDP